MGFTPKLKKTLTAANLRERADAAEAAAESKARQQLENGVTESLKLHLQAIQLDFDESVEELRQELTTEAAASAKAALDARAAAAECTRTLESLEGRCAGLVDALENSEALRRERLDAIEQATAVGEISRALELEASLGELDPEAIRSELAAVRSEEEVIRDRVAQLEAEAGQHAAEARDLRRDLASVEDRFRPKYERRRRQLEQHRRDVLFVFDGRYLADAIATKAAAKELLAKPNTDGADSANTVLDEVRIETDAHGRVRTVEIPIET